MTSSAPSSDDTHTSRPYPQVEVQHRASALSIHADGLGSTWPRLSSHLTAPSEWKAIEQSTESSLLHPAHYASWAPENCKFDIITEAEFQRTAKPASGEQREGAFGTAKPYWFPNKQDQHVRVFVKTDRRLAIAAGLLGGDATTELTKAIVNVQQELLTANRCHGTGHGLQYMAVVVHNSFPVRFVMAEMGSKTLRDWMQTNRDVARSHKLFCSLCHRLAELHSLGVIHVDLKPENVVVHFDELRVTIIDFGLSINVIDGAHRFRGGTPSYAAPEVDDPDLDWVSHALDLWALGKIAQEMHACLTSDVVPDESLIDSDVVAPEILAEAARRLLRTEQSQRASAAEVAQLFNLDSDEVPSWPALAELCHKVLRDASVDNVAPDVASVAVALQQLVVSQPVYSYPVFSLLCQGRDIEGPNRNATWLAAWGAATLQREGRTHAPTVCSIFRTVDSVSITDSNFLLVYASALALMSEPRQCLNHLDVLDDALSGYQECRAKQQSRTLRVEALLQLGDRDSLRTAGSIAADVVRAAEVEQDLMLADAFELRARTFAREDSRARLLDAIDLYKKAADIRQRCKDNIKLAQTLHAIAQIYGDAHDRTSQLEYLTQALSTKEKTLGKVHPSFAHSQYLQATALLRRGHREDIQKAIEVLKHVLIVVTRAYGDQNEAVAVVLQTEAQAHLQLGGRVNTLQALEIFERVIRMREIVFGVGHLSHAKALHGKANALVQLGDPSRLQLATSLCEVARQVAVSTLGEKHSEVARILHTKAQALAEADDESMLEASSQLCNEALAIARALGFEVLVAENLSLHALVSIKLKRTRNTQRLCEECISIQQRVFGPSHPIVAHTLALHAQAMVCRDSAAAVRKCEEALTILDNAGFSEDLDAGKIWFTKAQAQVKLGRDVDALLSYCSAIRILKREGSSHDLLALQKASRVTSR